MWLVVGIVLIAAGFAVVTGAEWARWVGIVAATIAAIAFLPWIYGGNRSRMARARD